MSTMGPLAVPLNRGWRDATGPDLAGKVPRWTAWDERLLRERVARIAAARKGAG